MTESIRALRQAPTLTVQGLRELAWQEYREWRARIGRAPDTADVMHILAAIERMAQIAVTVELSELCKRVSELERHIAMLRQIERHERHG